MGDHRRQIRLLAFGAAVACLAPRVVAQQPELKYAVVVTRHGVRAPTWTAERLNQYSSGPWPRWGVPPSEMTAHGRELMKIMGGFYREFFANAGLLTRSGCADATRTYIWADTDQRTMETAKAIAEGALPGCTEDIHSVGEGKSDPLFDPIGAGAVKADAERALAAVTGRIGPRLDAVIQANSPALRTLNGILAGTGKPVKSIFDEKLSLAPSEDGVAMTGPLRLASTFSENLLLEYANGMQGNELGWGRLNEANLLEIMTLHTNYAELLRRTPYLAAARGGNLLDHILKSLSQAATGKAVAGSLGRPGDALLFVSGHDTNISNLAGILGLSWILPSYQPNDAPPGGALLFTLWRAGNQGAFTVRIQFVSQTMNQMRQTTKLSLSDPPAIASVFIPGCSKATEGFPCEWQSFEKTSRNMIITLVGK